MTTVRYSISPRKNYSTESVRKMFGLGENSHFNKKYYKTLVRAEDGGKGYTGASVIETLASCKFRKVASVSHRANGRAEVKVIVG